MDEDEAPSADPVEGRRRVNEDLLNNENPSLDKLVWLLNAVLQLPPPPPITDLPTLIINKGTYTRNYVQNIGIV